MKKVLLVVLIGFATLKINAQTEKGKFLIGASSSSLGFSSLNSSVSMNNSETEVETKNFNISVKVAYFLLNNIALGVNIPYSNQLSDQDSPEVYQKNTTFQIKPFTRIYAYSNNHMGVFLEGDVGFGKTKYELSFLNEQNNEQVYNVVSYQLGGGFSFFLTKYFSTDLFLGYSSTKNKIDNQGYDAETITDGFVSSIGFSFFL
ncbi:outer membrane beta-barrel protein [Wenyingzhuangia marina]|uniref:Outer membrane protein beta-barrel domain-containing protein n=1 Tax=Wenyingzhuangia marina TaxID=1195760 RepID=A0A1M5SF75_9FLAO|nr:outer membrane beta-barrel protein [Wenyingzhuangia marina]GGF61908.1 hypothetical protein GCM10011397_01290 [Wenyingzhuangia marina]SHH36928.1 Outer membrane protein beta-barrel domain-containing protein [Wenyingzhuangia marina]